MNIDQDNEKKTQSSLLYDNPLSKGYKTDMKKLEIQHNQVKVETYYYNKRKKVIKYSSRIFWISMMSFTLWVASGFYDLFPRLSLDKKIENYKENQAKRLK